MNPKLIRIDINQKKSLAKIIFSSHILIASFRGSLFMEKNTMKSLAYTLLVLFAALNIAHAAPEASKEPATTEEIAVIAEAEEVDPAKKAEYPDEQKN